MYIMSVDSKPSTQKQRIHTHSLVQGISTKCYFRFISVRLFSCNETRIRSLMRGLSFRKCDEEVRFLLLITKTRLYNIDPLKPHFYIVKLGFTGVCIYFLIYAKKHRLWVLVRTASLRGF